MTAIFTGFEESTLLARYGEFLKERRYSTGTIANWVPLARRILHTYPDGIPLDRDLCAQAVITDRMTVKTQKGTRTGAYRFCEYLETVERGEA